MLTLDQVGERMRLDVADHVMTVLHDEGLYRHVRFKRPDTWMYRFDLVSWPGWLAITGDMGSFTFRREEDMFGFVAGSRPNPDYWAEKMDPTVIGHREYDPDLARQYIERCLQEKVDCDDLDEAAAADLRGKVAEDLLSRVEDREDLYWGLRHSRVLDVSDWWETSFEGFTYQYLWCCWAMQWAVARYREEAGS